jgi:hypothetical protein
MARAVHFGAVPDHSMGASLADDIGGPGGGRSGHG